MQCSKGLASVNDKTKYHRYSCNFGLSYSRRELYRIIPKGLHFIKRIKQKQSYSYRLQQYFPLQEYCLLGLVE